MNRFALLSLYRSLTRHRLYAALNIGGLAVGIAVFLVLSLYVRFETSYERWLPDHDKTYVVRTIWKVPDQPFSGPSNYTMGGLLEQLREDFPRIVGTRLRDNGAAIQRGGVATQEKLFRVDSSFLDVIDLPMVAGDGPGTLATPDGVLISQTIARRYFGDANPIGQILTMTVDDAPKNYRVGGVFVDLPAASDMHFTILLRIETEDSPWWFNWGSTSLNTYVRFETVEAARAFEAAMPGFIDRRARENYGDSGSRSIGIDLLPITDMHLTPEGRQGPTARLTVTTLGIVGLLALVIAIVNYVNLATARAGLRAREVAMRKVLGASRPALIRQFLLEAVATVAIAALIGLMLAELGLPLVNAAGGLELSIAYLGAGGVVLPLALTVLLVGVAAGAYPAFLLARFPAASVLASARSPGGGRAGTRVREALVVFQFALAIAFMIGTAILFAQMNHVRQTDIGFRRDGLLVLNSFNWIENSRRPALLAALAEVPAVRSVALADSAAGGGFNNNSDTFSPGAGIPGISLRRIATGPRFFETYGARLLAGRLLGDDERMDDATDLKWDDHRNIVVNRTALPMLGYRTPQEAIGKRIGFGAPPRTIVGVVEDMRFLSPREPIDGTYYTYYREGQTYSTATVRFEGDAAAAKRQIEAVWQRIAPEVPFNAETGEQRLQALYDADDRASRLFGIGAGLAVLIGCVGLWGLASFNTQRRVKEIGIRKTLGASSRDIVRLLVGQFLRPVLIANLVAWPLAFFAMRTWLAGFDDRIALSPAYFVGASVVAVLIATGTVIGQSLRASRAAPSWALRHE